MAASSGGYHFELAGEFYFPTGAYNQRDAALTGFSLKGSEPKLFFRTCPRRIFPTDQHRLLNRLRLRLRNHLSSLSDNFGIAAPADVIKALGQAKQTRLDKNQPMFWLQFGTDSSTEPGSACCTTLRSLSRQSVRGSWLSVCRPFGAQIAPGRLVTGGFDTSYRHIGAAESRCSGSPIDEPAP